MFLGDHLQHLLMQDVTWLGILMFCPSSGITNGPVACLVVTLGVLGRRILFRARSGMDMIRDVPVVWILHVMELLSSAFNGMLTVMVWAMVSMNVMFIASVGIAVHRIWGKRHNMSWLFVLTRHGPRKLRSGRENFAPMAVFDQFLIPILLNPIGIGNHVARFNEPVDAGSTISSGFSHRIRHILCS